jgi:hypothetical protein
VVDDEGLLVVPCVVIDAAVIVDCVTVEGFELIVVE